MDRWGHSSALAWELLGQPGAERPAKAFGAGFGYFRTQARGTLKSRSGTLQSERRCRRMDSVCQNTTSVECFLPITEVTV